jgi:Tfp pilus assembly protein PilX
MGLISLASAARRRAQQTRADEDAGFMLIYVMAITAVIVILVGGTLVVTTNAIVPSVQSSYDQAADAAAQSGLQAFIAYIDATCATATSVSDCASTLNQAGASAIPVPGASSGYSATYSWVAQPDTNNPPRYFRVKSIGKVSQGGVSAQKVVVGDVVGGGSVDGLDYGVITGFESQSSSTVLSQWPARTIALDPAAIDAADVPIKGSTITWSGASPGSAAGKVAVCNATFDENGGRANTPAPKAPNPYVDWTESGLAGNNYTNFQPCQTAGGRRPSCWPRPTRTTAPAATSRTTRCC